MKILASLRSLEAGSPASAQALPHGACPALPTAPQGALGGTSYAGGPAKAGHSRLCTPWKY